MAGTASVRASSGKIDGIVVVVEVVVEVVVDALVLVTASMARRIGPPPARSPSDAAARTPTTVSAIAYRKIQRSTVDQDAPSGRRSTRRGRSPQRGDDLDHELTGFG